MSILAWLFYLMKALVLIYKLVGTVFATNGLNKTS